MKNIPIEINKIYDVEIISQNNMGEGVAKIDNFTIFVDNALINEKVTILITEIKKNYGRAKVINIKNNSIDRIDNLCDKYSVCGGCDLQHQIYDSQLKFKQKKVIDALTRIGKLSNIKVNNIIGMNRTINYRNKVIFHIDNKNLGFYEKKSHNIININNCLLVHPLINNSYQVIKDYLVNHSLDINQLMIRVGTNTNEIMIVLYVKYQHNKFSHLVNTLNKDIKEIKTIIVNDNNKEYILYGEGYIKEKILDKYFIISSKSFLQVNTHQAEQLYQMIKNYISIDDKLILDFYTGIGGIALSISDNSNKVIGIEIVEDAIKDAKENVKLNNVTNVDFILSDTNNIKFLIKNRGIKPDVIILDPPRRGSDIKTLDLIKNLKPKKIIYVSCEPTTLARDLNYLVDNDYKIEEITPVDMFPYTHHVECIVLIEKKGLISNNFRYKN